MSRTTQTYRHPPQHFFPPASDCTDADLQEIAALTISGSPDIMTSSAHVTAICGLVERQDLRIRSLEDQLDIARGVGAASWQQLQAANENLKSANLLLIAEMRRTVELQALNAQLSNELALTRRPAFPSDTERVQTAQVRAHRISLRPYAPQHMAWDLAPDRDVVDPEALDEPAASRTRTMRADTVPMAEMVEVRR